MHTHILKHVEGIKVVYKYSGDKGDIIHSLSPLIFNTRQELDIRNVKDIFLSCSQQMVPWHPILYHTMVNPVYIPVLLRHGHIPSWQMKINVVKGDDSSFVALSIPLWHLWTRVILVSSLHHLTVAHRVAEIPCFYPPTKPSRWLFFFLYLEGMHHVTLLMLPFWSVFDNLKQLPLICLACWVLPASKLVKYVWLDIVFWWTCSVCHSHIFHFKVTERNINQV